MALSQYNIKLPISGDIYWYRPQSYKLPTDSYKYIQTTWNDAYSLFRLAHMVYGDTGLYWLIMLANDITNPYSLVNGDKIKILLPKYLNEVTSG